MAPEHLEVAGNWYGMMVHYPNHGVIHVSFAGESGFYQGTWDFPGVTGEAAQGAFSATRFANWLYVRIISEPLADVQCQLTILEDKGKSMITGVIPLNEARIPFATVTLFRRRPKESRMTGICPLRNLRRKAVNKALEV